MPVPPLTLCRLHSRLDFQPKSLLYYGRRSEFASRYFPKLYADWAIKPNELRLTDHETEKTMVLTSDSIGFNVDGGLGNVGSIMSHMAACMRSYLDEIAGESKPIRLGIAMSFLTEESSFEGLYPLFKANTLMEEGWAKIEGYDIRDTGYTNIYYGSERNGLDLQIGILTAEQAVTYADALSFKRKRAFADIARGALLVALDRHIAEVRSHKTIEVLFSEHVKLRNIAQRLTESVLREDS